LLSQLPIAMQTMLGGLSQKQKTQALR
jgi:hypothetical protein